ncbi:MAG: hypothetical protein Q4G09_01545 [Clostridia bacterium]|nr:hypothetical protein [Clostridia bacterium]
MDTQSMKNMIVLKDLPSNIVEEAIVILKPNIKLKNEDLAENKIVNKKSENKKINNDKKYIINEAEMIISTYISKIEKEKKSVYKANKKIETKYKRLKIVSVILGVLFLVSYIIK